MCVFPSFSFILTHTLFTLNIIHTLSTRFSLHPRHSASRSTKELLQLPLSPSSFFTFPPLDHLISLFFRLVCSLFLSAQLQIPFFHSSFALSSLPIPSSSHTHLTYTHSYWLINPHTNTLSLSPFLLYIFNNTTTEIECPARGS